MTLFAVLDQLIVSLSKRYPSRDWAPACASLLLLVSGLCLAGCGKSPRAIASGKSKAFDSAPAATKQAWQTATAAAQTNGYSAALIALSQIQADTSLTAEQGAAVRELSTSLSDKMYEAANKGDPAAKAALQELRKLQAR